MSRWGLNALNDPNRPRARFLLSGVPAVGHITDEVGIVVTDALGQVSREPI